MFKFANLKLFRKFLILGVLSAGLFMTSSLNPANASTTFCCSECDAAQIECVAECNAAYGGSPVKVHACVHSQCNPLFYFCMQQCDPNC